MGMTCKVAVRAMVARVLRSGDLRMEFSQARRAREGIRIHRRIQKSRPASYMAEVPVTLTVETARAHLAVSGRIDGVYEKADICAVEEIKTTTRDLDRICESPDPVHLGQVQCYAYMYAVEKQLEEVEALLTYYQVDTGDMQSIARIYPLDELARCFNDITGRYLALIQLNLDWQDCRNASIAGLEFPFTAFRGGQREMAVDVYRAIRDQKQLLVQAATGIGKTMGTLFPAVKALSILENPTIFYLTARTTGRLAAQKAFAVMRAAGLRVKTLTLTAKDKICFLPERSCNPDDCQYTEGYYDRVDEALRHIFADDDFSRSKVEQVSREFRLCPFEFSLELVHSSDCVICDYNYAFDPRVSLRRFFNESGKKPIYLVDEAHNLVDRSRDMFSAQIEKDAVLALRRKLRQQLPAVYRCLGKINSWMLKARQDCELLPGGAFSRKAVSTEFLSRLSDFIRLAERWLAKNREAAFRQVLLEFYFQVVHFNKTADQVDVDYIFLGEQSGKNLRVRLFCLDPARRLGASLGASAAAVFFSATLTPANYFRRIFGCAPDTTCLKIGSAFPNEHFRTFVADRISTLYQKRNDTLEMVSDILRVMISKKRGNYLLFFPSYQYMLMVHAAILNKEPELNLIVQKPEMTTEEKAAFLSQFQIRVTGGVVGFAVLGGIFGEGIDLEGDRLTGAAVVGVGLPGISFENELIRHYFDTAERAGFQYAYQYPGINRVLQGGGRVIRTAEDRGFVLLVDSRYARYRYRKLLPPHWRPEKIRHPGDLETALQEFWDTGTSDLPETIDK